MQTSECFCHISPKSITIILSYTVSKLVHFFETQCSCKYSAAKSLDDHAENHKHIHELKQMKQQPG